MRYDSHMDLSTNDEALAFSAICAYLCTPHMISFALSPIMPFFLMVQSEYAE